MMEALGEPAWRGAPAGGSLYRQRVADISSITTLPKALRERLAGAGRWAVRASPRSSFCGWDGALPDPVPGAESLRPWKPSGCPKATTARPATSTTRRQIPEKPDHVLSPISRDRGPRFDRQLDRATICVSSQIGCAVNCQFCLTAKLGLQRNLTAGEIAGQVVEVFDRHAR